MGSQAFELAILLSLKDAASGGLDRFVAKLHSAGKEGEQFAVSVDKIRSNLNRDLAIGGVGLGGLKLLKDGIQVAADYETVMTDLRATIATTGKDGGVSLNDLARDMVRAEAVAVKLGNALPGTTADFAQMMQVLKQNGLQTTTIMDGAAEAVAHLAVASNAVPKEIAADFAQFGNLFKLKPEDFAPAADVFSRIFTSTGQTSQELVEAAKYFQGRAGTSLGIGGLKDAKEMTRLFGLMGMKGIRGSMGGTMLTDFFSEYNKNRGKIEDLQKATGIKLDFFDKKGKFAGMDTVFEQMKQFDKLSDKDRSGWLEKVFGLRGMTAANVFAEAGTDGWKQFNAEQDKTVGLEDKIAMKTATFNNQMEALKGTLENLKVAIFEPMLPGLTAAANKGNDLVTVMQQFAKAHPEIAKTVVESLALASAAMVAYSAFGLLTGGIRLFRLASAFSKAEGLLPYLKETTVAANTTGEAVVGATTKTAGLKKNLFSLNNVFKAVLVLEAVNFTWDQISNLRKTIDDWKSMNKGLDVVGKMSNTAYQNTPANERDPKREANNILTLLQGGNQELSKALDPSKESWMNWYSRGIGSLMGKDTNYQLYQGKQTNSDIMKDRGNDARVKQLYDLPAKQRTVDWMFDTPYARIASENAAVKNLRNRAPGLADPQVMGSFRRDVMPTMGLSENKQGFMNQILQQAFPESFSASMTGMFQKGTEGLVQSLSSLQQPIDQANQLFTGLPTPMTDTSQAFTNLPQPIGDTNRSLVELYGSANRLPGSFSNIFSSANSLSLSLDGVSSKISSWQPPASPTLPYAAPGSAPGGTTPSILDIPQHAVGGTVLSDGLIMAHAGNVITPAKTTRGLKGFAELMTLAKHKGEAAGSVSVHYAPTINIHGGSETAKQDFEAMLYQHSKEIERIASEAMRNGRVRS